ncbi:hypothetical protein BTO23_13100 [Aliivibrio sifiae]|uniref:Uncharacterized protein n=1 Tax=Aliivibrio sifiae TaxID=566293 RepID=A0A2S7X6T1_9GAMM|nr:hypothetical protein BTO23_13100 [Aliivibrio sifiae]GLR73804.1 hypothetical protein GCM10007855_06780 [Aliivibrio sifiae]
MWGSTRDIWNRKAAIALGSFTSYSTAIAEESHDDVQDIPALLAVYILISLMVIIELKLATNFNDNSNYYSLT